MVPTELFVVSVLRALVEVAGLFLLGQGVLYLLAGARREKNAIYQLFQIVTSSIILTSFHRYLNNKEIDLERQLKVYHNWNNQWEEQQNEFLDIALKNYQKFNVLIENEELIFYKSVKTGRWWIEIPFLPDVNNKLKKHTLLPCMHEDYIEASHGKIPERSYKAYKKNSF